MKNGNVRAVIAGHIHQMRYDGVRDGIGYYALATTGGSLPQGIQYRRFGLLHHFNVVTVRDEGFSVAAIPVGSVFDPKQFDPARLADVEAARYLLHELRSPPIPVHLDGSATTTYRLAVTNPCALPIDVTLLGTGDETWLIAPVPARQARRAVAGVFNFACIRDARFPRRFRGAEVELRFTLSGRRRSRCPIGAFFARKSRSEARRRWPRPTRTDASCATAKRRA